MVNLPPLIPAANLLRCSVVDSDTGGESWFGNISENFRKNSKWSWCYYQTAEFHSVPSLGIGSSAELGMSSFFRGIRESVPSLFRGIFSGRNSVANPRSPVELSDGRGGRGWRRSQIIRQRGSLIPHKSFNTLCTVLFMRMRKCTFKLKIGPWEWRWRSTLTRGEWRGNHINEFFRKARFNDCDKDKLRTVKVWASSNLYSL